VAIRSVFHLMQQFSDKSLTHVNGTEYDDVAQNDIRWQTVVKAVVKLRLLQNAGIDLLVSIDELCCVKLIGSVN